MVAFGGGLSRIPCLGLPVDGGPVGLDHNGTSSENRRPDPFPRDTKKALTDRSFSGPGWGRRTCYVPDRLPPARKTEAERAIRRKGLNPLVRPFLDIRPFGRHKMKFQDNTTLDRFLINGGFVWR